MQVDGVPERPRVRRAGALRGRRVEPQNVIGSLDRDLLAVVDKIGRPFTPVGFYYRTMIRPRRLWPVYEKVPAQPRRARARRQARRPHGALRRRAPPGRRARGRRRRGSGLRGRARPRRRGEHVAARRRERAPDLGDRSRSSSSRPLARSASTRAASSRSRPGRLLLRVRAKRIVVATGAVEQPLVFPGNDLVGVMLPDGVAAADPRLRAQARRARGRGRGRRPRRSAAAEELRARRRPRRATSSTCASASRAAIAAEGRRGRAPPVTIDGDEPRVRPAASPRERRSPRTRCSPRPARGSSTTPARGIFVPTDLPPDVEAVGSVTGELGRGSCRRARGTARTASSASARTSASRT